MHRIDTATKSVDLFGAGKHGFKDGNPTTSDPATALNASWFNALQEELATICEAAGLTLDTASVVQVLAAIRAMFFSRDGTYGPTADLNFNGKAIGNAGSIFGTRGRFYNASALAALVAAGGTYNTYGQGGGVGFTNHTIDVVASGYGIGARVRSALIALGVSNENADLVFETNDGVNGLQEVMRVLGGNGVGKYLLVGYTTSNGAYRAQVNGQIFATSSTVATSDGRYKTNVKKLSGALDLVTALRPVSFNWKKHPVHEFNRDAPTIGFIAQEVQEVLKDRPWATSIVKANTVELEPAVLEEIEPAQYVEVEPAEIVDGEVVKPAVTEMIVAPVMKVAKEAVTEEFLGIAEGNLIALLTAAVQELAADVAALKAK